MAESDITYNSSFSDSTRAVNGRIEITNSPTSADLKQVAEGATITDLTYEHGVIVATKDIHLMTGGSFENCRNIDIILKDGARFTNADSTPSNDNPTTDGQMKLNDVRLMWSRDDSNNGSWARWPFRPYSTQAYSNWGKVNGGSFSAVNPGSITNIRIGFSELNNYRITANENADEIDQVAIRNTLHGYNLDLNRVKTLTCEVSANAFLENVTQSASGTKTLFITRYASLILNNWTLNNTQSALRQYTHQGTDTPRDHHVYMLGTASDHFPASYSDITVTTGSSVQRRRAHFHKGGLRYYQIFKDGSPITEVKVAVYRGSTEQKSKPVNTAEMLDFQGSNNFQADGKVKLATLTKTIHHNGTTWTTDTHSDISLKIKNHDIIHQKINLTEAQANESIGNNSLYIPLVVQPDLDYTYSDTGQFVITISPNQHRIGIFGTGNLQQLYNALKDAFTNNMAQDLVIRRSGTWIELDWDISFDDTQEITTTEKFKGIRLFKENSQFHNLSNMATSLLNGLSLQSDQDGISVTITSNVTPTKYAISNTNDKTNPTYHETPHTEFLDVTNDYLVTAKADGHVYQQFTIDAGTTSGTLDMRLPADTNIDLETSIPDSLVSKITVSGLTEDVIEYTVTAEINLIGERAKSMRLIDRLYRENNGMRFLHNFDGTAYQFLYDRVLIPEGSTIWHKSTAPNIVARIGVPLYDIIDEDRYYAERTATNGYVVFDDLQLIGFLSEERVEELEEKFEDVVESAHETTNEKIDQIKHESQNDNLGYINIPSTYHDRDYTGAFNEDTYLHLVDQEATTQGYARAIKFNQNDGKFYSGRNFATIGQDREIICCKRIGNNYMILLDNGHLVLQPVNAVNHHTFTGYRDDSATSQALAFCYIQGHTICLLRRLSDNAIGFAQKIGTPQNYSESNFRIVWNTAITSVVSDKFDIESINDKIYMIKNGSTIWEVNLEFNNADHLTNVGIVRSTTLRNGAIDSLLFEMQNYIWYRQSTNTIDRFVPISPDTLEIFDEVEYHKSTEIALLEKIDDIDSIVETNLDATISSRLPTANYSPTDLTSITADVTSIKSQTDKMIFQNIAIQGEDPIYRLATHTWYEQIAGTTMTAGAFLSQFHQNINTALNRLTAARAANLDNLDATISSRLATSGYTAPTSVDISSLATKTKQTAMQTSIDAIKTKTDKIRFDNTNHIESSIQDVKGVAVTDIDDFKADVSNIPTVNLETKINNIKSQTDKIRFVGTADQAGTQKISAEATVTGNVESSGLTETQSNQLSHVYNQTLVDDDDDTTTLREQANAIKSAIDNLPDTTVDLTGIARVTDVNSARDNIKTDIQTNEDKIDAIKTVVDTIPTTIPDNTVDITAIKNKTDKLQFTRANDVKSTLDGELVKTDSESRQASKATGYATPSDIPTSDITAIKSKTDNLQFTTSKDVKATLDGEAVTTDTASRTASRTDLTGIARTTDITSAHSVTNRKIDSVKTETSTIKTKTDKLQFNDNNDVISTLDGETVTTGDISDSALQSIRQEIEDEDNKLHDVQGKVTSIKSKVDTNLNETVSSRASQSSVDSISTKDDQIKTETDKIQSIKERTDKLYFEGEQKTNTRDKVQTYTTVEIGDTPVTIDLSTVEEGIEEIITQLTEDTDEDDAITPLKRLKDIAELARYLKDVQDADFEITDQYFTIKNRDTKQEIIKFRRNPQTTNADWSGGRTK